MQHHAVLLPGVLLARGPMQPGVAHTRRGGQLRWLGFWLRVHDDVMTTSPQICPPNNPTHAAAWIHRRTVLVPEVLVRNHTVRRPTSSSRVRSGAWGLPVVGAWGRQWLAQIWSGQRSLVPPALEHVHTTKIDAREGAVWRGACPDACGMALRFMRRLVPLTVVLISVPRSALTVLADRGLELMVRGCVRGLWRSQGCVH